MIDLIRIVSKKLSAEGFANIVAINKLGCNTERGNICYSNRKEKNLKHAKGIYINIDVKGSLKVEGSLHKYYNETETGIRQNYNLFSMKQAQNAIEKLLSEKAIPQTGTTVTYCEVGVNLVLPQDCISYLRKMLYIERQDGTQKRLYINPRFKDERTITTEFYEKIRTHYKAYDKGIELTAKTPKNRKELYAEIQGKNILRIETVHKRLENRGLYSFFTKQNLKKLQESFFKDWESVCFEPDVFFPPQTGAAKKMLAKEILVVGKDEALRKAKEAREKGTLTEKEYRGKREFIKNEWNTFKTTLRLEQSQEEKEYRKELASVKDIHINNL